MTEEILYTSLLKGAIIGDLPYSNQMASAYAKQIKNDQLPDRDLPNLFEKLKPFYGYLLEASEETDFERLLQSLEKQRIIDYLLYLEKIYNPYFLRLISKRCHEVQLIYDNVASRIKSWHFEDMEIQKLKTAESNQDFLMAVEVHKKVEVDGNKAIGELYKNTESVVYHYVLNNSGDANDSAETWCVSFSKFWGILKRKPNAENKPKFYEWRPIATLTHPTAKVSTFFIGICYNKWKDELRRRKRSILQEPDFIHELDAGSYDDINQFYDFEDLKYNLKKAIERLGDTCKKIIKNKYFGGEFGDGLSSKETAQVTGLAVGTIDNNHPKCLKELHQLMIQQKK
jgi:RNA polymerase sigma factor (sigma-70 family)